MTTIETKMMTMIDPKSVRSVHPGLPKQLFQEQNTELFQETLIPGPSEEDETVSKKKKKPAKITKKNGFVRVRHATKDDIQLRMVPMRVFSNYDGDTISALFPLFNDIADGPLVSASCRLDGIDTREIKGTRGQTHALALAAKEYVKTTLVDKLSYGYFLTDSKEKFGRLLVWCYTQEGYETLLKVCDEQKDGVSKEQMWELSVNNQLIKAGLAVAFDGKTKSEFEDIE